MAVAPAIPLAKILQLLVDVNALIKLLRLFAKTVSCNIFIPS